MGDSEYLFVHEIIEKPVPLFDTARYGYFCLDFTRISLL